MWKLSNSCFVFLPGSSSADELAEKLCNAAQKNGSTDDVSVVCAQLKI